MCISILPLFYLDLPLFNLVFYLIRTSAQLAISNDGVETTVYRPLETWLFGISTWMRSFAPFRAFLRTCVCALLRSSAGFCMFLHLRLKRPQMPYDMEILVFYWLVIWVLYMHIGNVVLRMVCGGVMQQTHIPPCRPPSPPSARFRISFSPSLSRSLDLTPFLSDSLTPSLFLNPPLLLIYGSGTSTTMM